MRIISITSGKGGVGKTTLIANAALKLAQKGKKVLILDGDLGMANVDIAFGLKTEFSIHDVLMGRKELKDIIVEVAKNVFLIPGGSGIVELSHLNHFERRAIVDMASSLPFQFDYLLIDTAPGISENVLYLNAAAQSVVMVVTPDPASFADSYALIKVLHQRHKINRVLMVCNQVKDEADGMRLYQRFNEVVGRFLNVGLSYIGSVPMDQALRSANHMQRLVVRQDPGAISAQAISNLVPEFDRYNRELGFKSGMQGFWEQVVGVA